MPMLIIDHHEIDTVIGHSLGGSVAFSLEQAYKKQDGNPYGIIQSKTFGSPTVSFTEDKNTNVDRIRYLGDPISMLDFNSTTIMPSFKQRWKQSAHSYAGLEIADKVPLQDNEKSIITIW